MRLLRQAALGSLCLGIVATYPHFSYAEGFKNRDFIEMPNLHKKIWLNGAIDTLGHVAMIKSKEISQCIYDWYFPDTANKAGSILASIRQYPEHTPSAVVIVMLENACGKFVQEE